MKEGFIIMILAGLLVVSFSYGDYYNQESYYPYGEQSAQSQKDRGEVATISSPPSDTRRWYKNAENREAYMRGESRDSQVNRSRNTDSSYQRNEEWYNRTYRNR